MTTANINIRQVLLKRGNTAVSSLYTGPMGEVTFDTTLKALRIHDGSKQGGWLQASSITVDYLLGNVAEISSNVTALWGNAAVQQTQIDALIAAPKMVRITEVDEVALHTADTFVTLLEPAGEKGMAAGTKK